MPWRWIEAIGTIIVVGDFKHMAKNYRNRGTGNRIGKGRRLEYGQRLVIKGNNGQSNLNGKRDLVVLN